MREFLKGLDLDKETIDTIMAEHGKLLTRHKEQAEEFGIQLTAANGTIQTITAEMEEMKKLDYDGIKAKLDDALAQAAQAQEAAEAAKQEATEQIAAKEYEYAVNDYLGTLKFSSEYAKRGFVEDFKTQGFKLNEGKFLGADDYVKQIAEKDPATFAPDENVPKLQLTAGTEGKPSDEDKKPKKPTTFF